MAKTIDRFKTVDGQTVTLVAANVFAVVFSKMETDVHKDVLPDGASIYEVISTGGYSQLVVQRAGESIEAYITEALE